MIKIFLKHQWLTFRRSPSFEKDLGVKIFLGVVGLFALVNIFFLSASLPEILNNFKGGEQPIIFINSFLLYYFTFELLIRYFLQTVPVLDVEPYLHLPISKKKIGGFLIGKSILSPFNLIAPAIFLPIFIRIAIPEYGLAAATAWLAFILFLSLSLHFFNILFKKKLETHIVAWVIIALIVGGRQLILSYTGTDILPLKIPVNAVLDQLYLLVVPLAFLIYLTAVCYHFFTHNLYVEDLADAKSLEQEKITSKLTAWEGRNLTNALIVQELKLILRHKRSKSSLFISAIFMLYPLIFLNGKEPSPILYVIVGILVTGSFVMNYGQFLWSWNTNQMDFFLTQVNSYRSWVNSRYRLLVYSVLITTILALPYLYFGYELILMILAGALFNLGINSFLIMRLSLWSPKGIDLSKSSVMNYQGVGAAQFLMGLPTLILPAFIYGLPAYLWGHNSGMIIFASAGVLGIVSRKFFFNLTASKIKKDKYKLIHDLTI